MKRLLVLAAAAAAVISASVAPVFASSAPQAGGTDSHSSLIVGAERWIADTVNPILGEVPTPDGWHRRFLCAWNYQTNQQVCLYFPWPA
jgi:hypothetical protein